MLTKRSKGLSSSEKPRNATERGALLTGEKGVDEKAHGNEPELENALWFVAC